MAVERTNRAFDDEETPLNIPYVPEAFMDEVPTVHGGARRNEDSALDMMRFIALTTGIGKTGSPGPGFQGGTVSKAEDYAEQLLQLYGRCLAAVQGKK